MPVTPAPPALSEADYEAIEDAVMETMRGRWFLAEYARRNRHADTTMLLMALERIEAAMREQRAPQPVDQIRFDLIEMAKAIARTKAEIAAIKPDAEHHGKFGEASEELDSIVQATEFATSDILAAAEQIQEIAWTLREQGFEAEVCDVLDAKATDVYTTCSFQDLTGQRTRKVIQVLRYLEGRINAMIGIWGLEGAMAAEADETVRAGAAEALLHGPAKPGFGLDQADVDMVMGPAEAAPAASLPAARPVEPPIPQVERPAAPATPVPEQRPALVAPPPAAPMPDFAEPVASEPEPELALEAEAEAEVAAVAPAAVAKPVAPPLQPEEASEPPARPEPRPVAQPISPQVDPLAAVTALSYEEKIALFT